MKTISTILLLLVPFFAGAKIGLTLNTGVNTHDGPIKGTTPMGSQPGISFDGRVSYNSRRMDAGVGITRGMFNYPDNLARYGVPRNASDPFTAYYAFCNIKIHPRKLYYYLGANAGVLHIAGTNSTIYYSSDLLVTDPDGSLCAATGYFVGAEAGAGYRLNKRINIHASMGARYAYMTYDNEMTWAPQRFQFAIYQLLVGVTYQLPI